MKFVVAAALLMAIFTIAVPRGAYASRQSFDQAAMARDCPVDFKKVNLRSIEGACNADAGDATLCCATLYGIVTPYAGVINAIDSCAGALLDAIADSSLSNNEHVLRCFEDSVAGTAAEETAVRMLQEAAASEPMTEDTAAEASELNGNTEKTNMTPGRAMESQKASVDEKSKSAGCALRVSLFSVGVALVISFIATIFVVA